MLLGTWNLENLYRPGSPFGPKDKTAYETKLAALAAVITELDPTLLGVQEVGDPDALADLAGMLDGSWHLALSAHPDERGIRVGFLSRLLPRVLADTNAFPGKLRPVQGDDAGDPVSQAGRGFLAVEIATPALTLKVAVCHLKSKLLSYPGGRFQPRDEGERARYGAYALYRRAAEAATLRALADELLAGEGRTRDVAVLGDLNDEVQAATTQILLGPPGSEIGTPGYEQPDRGDATRLWDVAPRIPADRRYSRINSGRRELIDHILVSHRLVHRIGEAGTGLPAGGDAFRLPSIGADPGERRGAPGSDHAPVWVRVEV
ncbi:endonuclease/exonuclease/phosphatase family protein [Streptomyces avermitilis]|uniref:endonuclease/exonuclease/phosphatase family protein n=1 Tax=Streptomyces avermitilis TaxID=33903 RepID=UPI0037F869C5